MARLTELTEAEASPEKKAIYAEIRAYCRAPMVALIYRHLGSLDGVLEWAWGALAPVIRSGALPAAAEDVAAAAPYLNVEPFDRAALDGFGFRAIDSAAIQYVIAGYHAANPCNILAVLTLHALLAEADGHGTPAELPKADAAMRPVGLPVLPAMIAPDHLPAALDQLRPVKAGEVGLVPSLYRHLAYWPDWLEAVAEQKLAPLYANGEISRAARALHEIANVRAIEMAGEVSKWDGPPGRPSGAAREHLRTTLEAFVDTIPELIIVGRVLRQTTPAA